MATLSTIMARQPQEFQNRYGGTYWIDWINELLEELSGAGLMPSLKKEYGAIVEDYVWIYKPSSVRHIYRICNPENLNMRYEYEEYQDKIRLLNCKIPEDEDPDDTADAFQNYAVGSMDIDIDDAEEDDYKNYLLVIDGGTSSGDTIILKGNDASATGYCKVYFRHDLSAVLDNTKITSCYLLDVPYWVLIKHRSSYDDITSTSDEVPIDDRYERRITKAWLKWKAMEHIDITQPETKIAFANFQRVFNTVKAEIKGKIQRPVPRYIPGLIQYRYGAGEYDKDYAETDRYEQV